MKTMTKSEGIGLSLTLLVLALMALPNFISPRVVRSQNTCISVLKQIDGAKEQFALDHKLRVGAQVHWTNLVPEYIHDLPECPRGGIYTIGPVGTTPTCSVKEHVMP